ncbi:MAG: hypothetical protein HOG79_10595, partial [Prolixibacteraceae bacterium]|nr:hypothetical protein [Prolixibacteraceae bacterium]
MISKIYHLAITLLFISSGSFAQNINTYFEKQQTIPFQKLYLHTDREFYFLGDTIWLSGYLLDGKTHSPVLNDQNLYVDLIDSLGTVVTSEMFPNFKGFSEGNIPLTDTSLIGNIVLRAYTNYLQNFGEECFFYKTLTIDKTKNSFEIGNDSFNENNKKVANFHVEFFPESGILLENTLNVVAVKIIDEKGQGVNTNGSVVDNKNRIVARFKTIYKGLGKFYFHPNSADKYKTVLDSFPQHQQKFIQPEKSGIKLQIIESNENGLDVSIFSSPKKSEAKVYTLACANRGEVLFYREIELAEHRGLLKVDKNLLGQGINRFVLFNEDLNPISDRLYFNNNIEINSLQIELPKSVFPNRSQVNLKLVANTDWESESARLSIAVVNENSLNAFGETQNMMSRLFLDSELRGTIKSPLDYFKDEPEISSLQKLDLLMLTHGWSKYIWNHVAEIQDTDFEFPVTSGLDINGYVKNLWRKKRIEKSEVILTIKNDSLYTFWETTDKEGRFSFKHIYLSDSAEITLMARKSNENQNTQIVLEQVKYNVPDFSLEKFNHLFYENRIPMDLYRQNYYARLSEKEFEPEKVVILIKEVEVKAKFRKKEEVKFSQIYSESDYSIKTTEADFMYKNLKDFLFAKAPVMFGSRPPGTINAGGSILFYIDGIPTEERIVMGEQSIISVSYIDR